MRECCLGKMMRIHPRRPIGRQADHVPFSSRYLHAAWILHQSFFHIAGTTCLCTEGANKHEISFKTAGGGINKKSQLSVKQRALDRSHGGLVYESVSVAQGKGKTAYAIGMNTDSTEIVKLHND